MRVPAEVTSVEGFVDLVVQLASHGYYFWVQGSTKNSRGLSAEEIDRRQIERFDANLPKRARSYQREKGNASVRYVRYGRDWWLFWTHGKSSVYEKYKRDGVCLFNDFREPPSLKFHGYGISLSRGGYEKKTPEEKQAYREAKARAIAAGENHRRIPRGRRHERWVARVVINDERFRMLEAELLGMATHRTADYLAMKFSCVPFLPYAPVKLQLKQLLRHVNKARQHVGYERVPIDCIRYRKKMTSPYRQSEELRKAG